MGETVSLLNYFLKNCPKYLRGKITRQRINLDYEGTNDFTIKIADTVDEFEGAFKVLHDCYVEKHYMEPSPSGMRMTPYHLLPTTTTFVVKIGRSVIGTLSVIKEGALGVPSESLFDLSFLKEKKLQIAEISSLAIAPTHRRSGGRILFSLMKFMWHYVTEFMLVDALVVSVNPIQKLLYDDILLFTEMKLQVKSYSFVRGAEAIGRYALVKELPAVFQKPTDKNALRKTSSVFLSIIMIPIWFFQIVPFLEFWIQY